MAIRSPLLSCLLIPVVAGVSQAQSIARTAAAVTDLVVEVLDPGFPPTPQTATIPSGTILQDQQTVQVGQYPLRGASLRAVLPATATDALTHFEGRVGATGVVGLPGSVRFGGDVLVTLTAAGPAAVDLELRAVSYASVPTNSPFIDVHDDGTVELAAAPFSQPVVAASAIIGAAGLPIRMGLYGTAISGQAGSLDLDLLVTARLIAVSQTLLAGCGGPTLAVIPITTSVLRAAAGGLAPTGVALAVLGFGQTAIALPFGGCVLGVTPDVVLGLAIDPSGSGAIDFVVPPGVSAFAANAQVVGVDFAAPGAITTSDARRVQVTR